MISKPLVKIIVRLCSINEDAPEQISNLMDEISDLNCKSMLAQSKTLKRTAKDILAGVTYLSIMPVVPKRLPTDTKRFEVISEDCMKLAITKYLADYKISSDQIKLTPEEVKSLEPIVIKSIPVLPRNLKERLFGVKLHL